MKRIIVFCICVLMSVPGVLSARTIGAGPEKNYDTASNSNIDKRLILHGSLSAFNAAYNKNYFELNWNTLGGKFERFEIERSFDGEKYERIGTLSNLSEISADGQYAFRDHFHYAIATKNDFYYRIKEVEANGNITYSKVLIARMYNTRNLASMSVTPDPLANDILVNVQLNQDCYVMMKVMDDQGNLLLKEGKNAENGTNVYTLEGTHSLRPGMYTLEVTVNSKEKMIMKLAKG